MVRQNALEVRLCAPDAANKASTKVSRSYVCFSCSSVVLGSIYLAPGTLDTACDDLASSDVSCHDCPEPCWRLAFQKLKNEQRQNEERMCSLYVYDRYVPIVKPD